MPNAASKTPYAQLCELHFQAATLGSIGSMLGWDQETYMPRKGGGHRAEQQELIARLHHERATDKRIGELLAACETDKTLTGDKASPIAADVREMRRDYDRATKLPAALVAELAKVGSQAQEVWKDARKKNDFAMFRPWLEKMMELTRRKAECYRGLSRTGELYDSLIDEYEPNATAAQIEAIFKPLRDRLSALVKELAASGKTTDERVLHAAIDPARQHELGQMVLKAMGFDFEAGRLDTTTHPFCSGMGPGDTRLTTRYRDQAFTDALYSSMHEGGHGLYEQGLPKLENIAGLPPFGRPLAQSISLGIHESQSRMWENFVGRSREFWMWLWPTAQQMVSPTGKAAEGPLAGFTVDQIYAAVNLSKPSFIRVEADEATYNLHVMLRFELERAMISGAIAVKDLPGEWNKRFKQYFGLDVPDDARGCLQDVHWSFGLIGYFPTYTLGNLYAAQFWETINQQIPDLKARMARGDFAALKQWLNTNIHAHGRRYGAAELCQKLTGKPLGADPLMRHLEGKLRPLYA
jgi:carboxypeptidase Taq